MTETQKTSRIGLFGGSFDPIHLGHLIIAEDAYRAAKLDQVVFLPAYSSPLRSNAPNTPAADRLAMVKAAVDPFSHFTVDEYDIQQGRQVYSYETVRHYRQQYPQTELFFLIGWDQALQLQRWQKIEELRREVTFLCAARDSESDLPEEEQRLADDKGLMILPSRRVDLSASEIRERAAAGQSIRSLVPHSVAEDYIEQKSLYSRG